MKQKQQLYSGKAKTLFATDDPDALIVQYRDDATAFNGVKKASLERKGIVNNYFNAFIMQELEKKECERISSVCSPIMSRW